ncbi:MAG: PCRF domain-containing protein, partial [Gemmatimonadota bacterium]|nr:PCRF domain-containing protein [Gemmatimonadota bacterium]
MKARLAAALARAGEVAQQLADPATARDSAKLKTLGREYARLERIRKLGAQYEKLVNEREQARDLAADPDPQLAELAQADLERVEPELEVVENALRELLIPPDPFDARDTIVEIRAGTGGDEAALFAADVLRM